MGVGFGLRKNLCYACRSRADSFDLPVEPGRKLYRAAAGRKSRGEKAMRVMVIVKASKESEAGILPDAKVFEAMGRYNDELLKAGIMVYANGLRPSSKGKRVKFSGDQRIVMDGPFAETKELIGGFWIWQVQSMDEAVEWLKRAPFGGGVEVEIRQFHESEDLASIGKDAADQHARLQAASKLSAQSASK
jgi:hypothetical protein